MQAPGGGATIFISYARADDQKPPFEDTVHGWVTFFWDQLRWVLTNRGTPQAKLWLDRHEIEPAEEFTPRIEQAIRESRLFIVILSPSWVQRPWLLRELEFFCASHPRAPDDIILVIKREPVRDSVPAVLQNREGYRFFDRDPSGRVREFYWRGLQDQKAYFDVLDSIADRIYERLTSEPALQKTTLAGPNGRVLFVAVTADELRGTRQRLVNDLSGAGYTIVPEEDRLPDTVVEAERVIRAALGKAEFAVHLLGEHEGVLPSGGNESIVRLQLRLAREHAAAAAGVTFPRLLWAPKWLPDRPQAKRDPFQVVDRFGELQHGEEIYGEGITDLSQLLRRRLERSEPSPEEANGSHLLLIAGATAADDELVSTLAYRLKGSGPQPLVGRRKGASSLRLSPKPPIAWT